MITKNEIISQAFRRPINPDLIKDEDINLALLRYVNNYISGYPLSYLDSATVKNVMAYGVAYDIMPLLDVELSDRGVVRLSIDGVGVVSDNDKAAFKRQLYKNLLSAVSIMIKDAESKGYNVVDVNTDINIICDRVQTMTL